MSGVAIPGVRAWNVTSLRLVATYIFLTGLALSPLLWVSIPALVDYPNHLARMWVLAHPHAAAAVNYMPHWQLLPALAMDLLVPALAQFMPIEVAGRIFVAMTLILLILGTMSLHRVRSSFSTMMRSIGGCSTISSRSAWPF